MESNWQPIESAPKDGRQVMATFKGQYGWVMFVAYCERHHGPMANGYAAPTHWQPLPAPPDTQEVSRG